MHLMAIKRQIKTTQNWKGKQKTQEGKLQKKLGKCSE